MRSKVKVFSTVIFLFIIIIALSSCGVASVSTIHEGTAITQKDLMKTPIGTTQEDILARFGEPSKTTYMTVNNKKEDVWFYCWKRGTRGSVLFGLVGGSSAKAKCATFIFKGDKLVSKGIGRGANAELAPTIRVQKTEVVKHENSSGGLN